MKKLTLSDCFTALIIILMVSYSVIPMVLLREKYIFTIHDGLDSYAGLVQMFHDRKLYFSTSLTLPFMNDLEKKYSFISFNLYDFLNCTFGFLTGQILTRIIGVVLGFVSFYLLLKRLFVFSLPVHRNIAGLLSIAYAITPCAPNRMIAFASLPFVVYLFLYLSEKNKFTFVTFTVVLCPFLSNFAAVLIFVIGAWFIGSIIRGFQEKKLNMNLFCGFVLICISTMVIYFNFFLVALSANDTNRSLSTYALSELPDVFHNFRECLLYGQYHSAPFHGYLLLPFLIAGTICLLYYNRKKTSGLNQNFLMAGWFIWFFSAFMQTFQNRGFKTGVLLIDGFQWGRIEGIMRIIWYLMLSSVIFSSEKTAQKKTQNPIIGAVIVMTILASLF